MDVVFLYDIWFMSSCGVWMEWFNY